ncbi:MAG TPA: hypothetical protein VKA10_08115, partial [Prolixibacteraceae bacterium]|nr:hypothetical protein [Prolixibacteraceae bacterium]
MFEKRSIATIFLILLCGICNTTNAQDPNRFKEQVDRLANKEHNFDADKKLVIFAGSSSIVMWKDVQQRFPEYNVVNNGFGGSHFSDLIYFYDKLLKNYDPEMIFIYEGDNDIAGKKRPGKIKRQAKKLRKMLREDFPETKVVFISPKPSIAREHLGNKYMRLNRKLERYANRKDNTEFA